MVNNSTRFLSSVLSIILIIGLQQNLYSQDEEGYFEKARFYETQGKLSQAVEQLNLTLNDAALPHTTKIAAHLWLSKLYEDLGEIEKFRAENDHATHLISEYDADSLWVKLYQRQAKEKLINHDSEGARKILEEALKYALRSKNSLLEATILSNLSIPSHYEADYTGAIDLLQRSEGLFEKSLPDDALELGHVYKHYADNWYLLHDIDTALYFYLKAQKIYEHHLPAQNRTLLQLNNEIGISFLNTGRLEEGIKFIDKTLSAEADIEGKHPIADAYYYKCQIELEMGHPVQALSSIKRSTETFESIYGNSSYWVTAGHVAIADVYKVLHQYDSAIYHHQLALMSNDSTFYDSNTDQNPGYESAFSSIYYLVVIWEKALTLTLLYKQTGDLNHLKSAHKAFKLAIQSLQNLRRGYTDEDLHIEFGDDVSDLYPDVLECLYILHKETGDQKYVNEAFAIAEMSKSYILMVSLQKNMLEQQLDSLAGLINAENEIHQRITALDSRVIQAQMDDLPKSKMDSLNDLVFLERSRYDSFLIELKRSYPEYHKLRFEFPELSLDQIDSKLSENEALIEYVVGDDDIYLILKSLSGTQFLKSIITIEDLEELVESFRISIAESDFDNFRRKGYKLFKLLIEPIGNWKQFQSLLFIPHYSLNYIPFELMITDTTAIKNYKELSYLIKNTEVRYGYSAAFSFQERVESRTYSTPVLAMAPASNEKLGNQAVLLSSVDELMSIEKYYDGKYLLGPEATKEMFIQHVEGAAIVHLATHAIANQENPKLSKIAFHPSGSETDLFAFEIPNLSLSAQLVVLSACNTGLGDLRKGEGVLGLSRNFSQAGSSNLVVSLWQTPDQSTAHLMAEFYKNLFDGVPKSKALHRAKLSIIENDDINAANPLLWGGFVLIGDDEVLRIDTSYPIFWYLLIGMVLFAVAVVIRKNYSGN